MTDLERAIQAIEYGLQTVTPSEERPAKKMELSQRMTYYKAPGFSAAFIYQEELAWTKGYGVVEAGGEKPVTHETIFQAASISKPVTVMVALHLVEAGLLNLDADVTNFYAPGRFQRVNSPRRARTDCAGRSPCAVCSRTMPG